MLLIVVAARRDSNLLKRLAGILTCLLAVTTIISPFASAQTVVTGGAGGAYFKFAVPANWNGDLLIWNPGLDEVPIAPFILDPAAPLAGLSWEQPHFSLAPLQFSEGFALATTTRSTNGWAVFKSNADLQSMLDAFVTQIGVPKRIFVNGRSFGSLVAIDAIETAHLGNVVGGFSMCGILTGSRTWDPALDLRLIYDAVCSTVAPIPGGAEGLPPHLNSTSQQIAGAVNQCTGVLLPGALRTPEQQERLTKILSVTGLPENFILTDMLFATSIMSDLVHVKLHGIGTGNLRVDYGDNLINSTIERVSPDPNAQQLLADSYTPSGKVRHARIVSLHTDKDGLALIENETDYSSKVPATNFSLAVALETTPSHCGFSPAEITAGWETLRGWVDGAPQPSAASILGTCQQATAFGIPGPCRFDPGFVLPGVDGRFRPR
jgi:hypothetical protein